MEIKPLEKEWFGAWDSFCRTSDDAWFWHTTDWLQYTLSYRPERSPRTLSFFAEESGAILAVCPLLLEEENGVKEFSFGGGYGPTPALANDLSAKKKRMVLKSVFSKIDALAEKHGAKRARFRFPILNKSFVETGGQKHNFLMEFGYLDTSLNTQVIDLRKPLYEIKSGVRHGHKADIARAAKSLTARIFDAQNITDEIFGAYKTLHHKAAGRVTRPEETFRMMRGWISTGNAFLVGAEKDGAWISFSYFYTYKGNAYYGSACNDPDEGNLPIAHFIQWSAIEYMKKNGFAFYEIGVQQYGPGLAGAQLETPSKKEAAISSFKRRFGGYTLPFFMGEKYYDAAYFKEIYEKRVARYAEKLRG